jgi:hypothetical protein
MPLDPNNTDVTQIEDALAKVLRENLYEGRQQVVIEPFNGTRPIGAYASVHFIDARPYQHEVYDYEEKDGEYREILRGERYCRVRLMFFNAGAMQTAIGCQNLLRSMNRTFDLAPIAGFGEIGEVQDISGVFGAKFEERAVFSLELYANMSAEYPFNWIRNVPGTVNGDDFLVDSC